MSSSSLLNIIMIYITTITIITIMSSPSPSSPSLSLPSQSPSSSLTNYHHHHHYRQQHHQSCSSQFPTLYPNKWSAVLYSSLCGPSKTPWTQTLLLPYLSGVILGSLYYGYPILQIAGGWLSLKHGGTKIFGCGLFLASLLTIFTAPAARYSVYALITLRAGEGLFLVTNTRRQ